MARPQLLVLANVVKPDALRGPVAEMLPHLLFHVPHDQQDFDSPRVPQSLRDVISDGPVTERQENLREIETDFSHPCAFSGGKNHTLHFSSLTMVVKICLDF
jgi:hypothetical protein